MNINIRRFKKKRYIIGVAIIVAVILILILSGGGEEPVSDNRKERIVELRTVAELNNNAGALSLVGEVTSDREVDIKTEASGRIVGVYRNLGETLTAGTAIAEIENSSQRARVLQAEAAVETAEANLTKLKGGARGEELSIAQANLSKARLQVEEARGTLVDAINGAYIKSDDAVRNKADQLFENARTISPQFKFVVPDSQVEINAEARRVAVEQMLNAWFIEIGSLDTGSDLTAVAATAKNNLDTVKIFLNEVALAVNYLTPDYGWSQSTIDGWKAAVAAARAGVEGGLASLSAARNGLSSQEAALVAAQQNLDIATSGGRTEDIASAEAALKQARGMLLEAQSNLAKTIIRTPITGTLISLDVELGEFVSSFQTAARVANESGVEIRTFISPNDKEDIIVGAEATIDEKRKGVVTEVAPAIDRNTRKIEVTIGVTGAAEDLINGSQVRVDIKRKADADQLTGPYTVPISALKVRTDGIYVFTVNEDGILVENQVEQGALLGDRVFIESGITPEMRIVVDARGLKEGEKIEVNK